MSATKIYVHDRRTSTEGDWLMSHMFVHKNTGDLYRIVQVKSMSSNRNHNMVTEYTLVNLLTGTPVSFKEGFCGTIGELQLRYSDTFTLVREVEINILK